MERRHRCHQRLRYNPLPFLCSIHQLFTKILSASSCEVGIHFLVTATLPWLIFTGVPVLQVTVRLYLWVCLKPRFLRVTCLSAILIFPSWLWPQPHKRCFDAPATPNVKINVPVRETLRGHGTKGQSRRGQLRVLHSFHAQTTVSCTLCPSSLGIQAWSPYQSTPWLFYPCNIV